MHTHNYAYNVRLGYIHVAGEEASVPGGVIGSLEGVEHQAAHSYQCLNSLFLLLRHVSDTTEIVCTHTQCEAGVYTCTCRILM